MSLLDAKKGKPRFIILTGDYSGFGFAKMIADAGYPVLVAYDLDQDQEKDVLKKYKAVGKGFFDRAPLERVFAQRDTFKDAYWFADQNNTNEYGQQLHDEGFKIWGGLELSGKMEHDRDFGMELAKRAGFDIPEEVEFQSVQDGIKYLEENEELAFVFKPNTPDSGTWGTYVPDSEKDQAANSELTSYLKSLGAGKPGGFILQERKRGVEVNFELWVRAGVPFFAWCDLESKKKLTDDMGPLVGGAQDVGFTMPVECKGIEQTVGKFLALEEFKDYTGFLDANVIISEKQHYFLEFCARTGYPAHPTLFTALARVPFPDILMQMIDGPEGDFYDNFKHGFGAGITLYTDKDRSLMPIYVSAEVDHLFYPYDDTMDDDLRLMAGAGSDAEVGVICGHGYTVKTAAEEALKNMGKINFPNRSARTDLDKNCYPSAPQGRYDALCAMRYLD